MNKQTDPRADGLDPGLDPGLDAVMSERRRLVNLAYRLLGSGEHLLYGLDLPALGYECTSHVPTAAATHVVLTRHR